MKHEARNDIITSILQVFHCQTTRLQTDVQDSLNLIMDGTELGTKFLNFICLTLVNLNHIQYL